jgi:surface protein
MFFNNKSTTIRAVTIITPSLLNTNVTIPKSKANQLSVEKTMMLCLNRHAAKIPSEIARLIFSYLYKVIDDVSIREAVKLFVTDRKESELIFGQMYYWETSRVTNMSQLFMFMESFNEDISDWDVSNVRDMSRLFSSAGQFNKPLENWNVNKVTNMSYMFHKANNFNQPLEKWDVSNVTNMQGMFYEASQFNQTLEKWNVSKVMNMYVLYCHTI